jgi:hypothetical protein
MHFSGSQPWSGFHFIILWRVNPLLGSEMVNRLPRLDSDVILHQWRGCQVTLFDVVAMRRAAMMSRSSSVDSGVRELVAQQWIINMCPTVERAHTRRLSCQCPAIHVTLCYSHGNSKIYQQFKHGYLNWDIKKITNAYVGSEALAAVGMKSSILWVITPRSLLKVN